MLESHYEIAEVREEMDQLMKAMNVDHFYSYITQTGLMLIDQKTNDVKMISIKNYSYNFEKMGHIKESVNAFLKNEISEEELYDKFKKIESKTYAFSYPIQVLSAGVICGAMYVLINSLTVTALLSFVIGIVAYSVYLILEKYISIKTFSVFLYSSFISIIAVVLFKNNVTSDSFSLVLSCIMPLLPGATLVNSIRASINGDYLTGLSMAADAINVSLMLGIPVAFILTNLM
ncbi:hypothetical protein CBF37_02945 [Vagococcus vulneris]|uniref:Threonine/serine exporter-like N-terminal domain-containing protein n=2 Tax=Vagococcus vulneris TaxID=1977869 RepID=A0A430A1Q2_9ENTE|nr:hypothetical protein CBF37_02945 [Vagococcus vulneris]